MSKDKATARPWRVVTEDGSLGSIEGPDEFAVAQTQSRPNDLYHIERKANADLIVTAVNERDQLLAEVAELRAEALKGICVYCGYIEQYESLEQKASEEGNAMRVAHIRQCEARPELKLIAYAEELQTVLRAAKDALRSYEYGNASPDLAKAIADKANEALTPH
jgi:hypothetical protein